MNYNGTYMATLDGSMADPEIDRKIATEYQKVYPGTSWSSRDRTGDIYKKRFSPQVVEMLSMFGINVGM
jgi:hypothetical protein